MRWKSWEAPDISSASSFLPSPIYGKMHTAVLLKTECASVSKHCESAKGPGPGYPILLRIAGNDFMKGSNTNHEAKQFAAEAEKAGVDLFNVTGGMA